MDGRFTAEVEVEVLDGSDDSEPWRCFQLNRQQTSYRGVALEELFSVTRLTIYRAVARAGRRET